MTEASKISFDQSFVDLKPIDDRLSFENQYAVHTLGPLRTNFLSTESGPVQAYLKHHHQDINKVPVADADILQSEEYFADKLGIEYHSLLNLAGGEDQQESVTSVLKAYRQEGSLGTGFIDLSGYLVFPKHPDRAKQLSQTMRELGRALILKKDGVAETRPPDEISDNEILEKVSVLRSTLSERSLLDASLTRLIEDEISPSVEALTKDEAEKKFGAKEAVKKDVPKTGEDLGRESGVKEKVKPVPKAVKVLAEILNSPEIGGANVDILLNALPEIKQNYDLHGGGSIEVVKELMKLSNVKEELIKDHPELVKALSNLLKTRKVPSGIAGLAEKVASNQNHFRELQSIVRGEMVAQRNKSVETTTPVAELPTQPDSIEEPKLEQKEPREEAQTATGDDEGLPDWLKDLSPGGSSSAPQGKELKLTGRFGLVEIDELPASAKPIDEKLENLSDGPQFVIPKQNQNKQKPPEKTMESQVLVPGQEQPADEKNDDAPDWLRSLRQRRRSDEGAQETVDSQEAEEPVEPEFTNLENQVSKDKGDDFQEPDLKGLLEDLKNKEKETKRGLVKIDDMKGWHSFWNNFKQELNDKRIVDIDLPAEVFAEGFYQEYLQYRLNQSNIPGKKSVSVSESEPFGDHISIHANVTIDGGRLLGRSSFELLSTLEHDSLGDLGIAGDGAPEVRNVKIANLAKLLPIVGNAQKIQSSIESFRNHYQKNIDIDFLHFLNSFLKVKNIEVANLETIYAGGRVKMVAMKNVFKEI